MAEPMLKNERILRLTTEEGQGILRIAINFQLPEKLGEKQYTFIERSLAADEVKKFYKALRDQSELLKGKKRYILFGPARNYLEYKDEKGNVNHSTVDVDLEIPIGIDKDAKSGAIWCLIVALHPGSPLYQRAGEHYSTFWPIAEKLKCVRAVQKEIGLDQAKPRRWDFDDEEPPANGDEKKPEPAEPPKAAEPAKA